MEDKDIREALQGLKDPGTPSFFCIKKTREKTVPGVFIDANRNGVIGFCDFLLRSVEESQLNGTSLFDVPDELQDVSDEWIDHLKIAEGNNDYAAPKQSLLSQIGYGAVLIACIVIFLIGIVSVSRFIMTIF